jgi:methionine synthase II (cobalamin-independent)
MALTKTITIEELLDIYPASVTFLANHGIRCIRCGEPIWGTLEEAAKEKGFSDMEIDQFTQELNSLCKHEFVFHRNRDDDTTGDLSNY